MFIEPELKKEHCISTTEKLLWNICEHLAALRKTRDKPVTVATKPAVKVKKGAAPHG
jgi:hypothetical protein